ncbi:MULTISPECIES: alpha-glucan family phosphorylase [unclassified Streptomyces]|uniref:alpha-glucan family phosphorylase n=1 Tax=unclassified Streptomyces TaxID=2593676 RepID=UPI00048FB986|nr:alpha-glucan family phosphorylase [Streptomyces sp. DpondAA-D4]MYY18422.1 alpha-glucan family phosphorylase [Streptomyces sp. SID4912]SCD31495.1 starch phosphorylase [Streptomyces sp. DpondAA-D4]
MKAIRRFTVRPVLPEPLQPLSDLARNLRWSWHTETQRLFQAADPEGWRPADADPVRLLGAVSAGRLAELAADQHFLRRLTEVSEDLRAYLDGPRWYQDQLAKGTELPAAVAYFSPEFGVTAALPQYSGGLGILAGDHLKAASDLGVPLIGVGLLYRHGYFRQSLSRDGWQQEHYPVLDPHELPLTLLRETDGTPSRVVLALPGGRSLYAAVWQAQVGRVPLLLLDSDVEENAPGEREVTDRLYGGGSDHRLLQEMLLGIGGVRAVRTYCRLTGHPAPEVFHTNEGHAGFLGLERIRELTETGLGFDAALETVRAGAVFTTHTPVPAGMDRFESQLVARHFADDGELPGVDVERILDLGTETYPGGEPGLFNMAVMGLRLAQRANGVSTLHGAVSREMFSGLWPGFDATEVPITSVTNGVHAPTWVAPEVLGLGARMFGAERADEALAGAEVGDAGAADLGDAAGGAAGADLARPGTPRRWDAVTTVPDREIWDLRRALRGQLVTEVRKRLYASWRRRGAGTAELGWIDGVLDPDVLTIGFARRVPSYKRLTLMLHDPDRLRALLLHPTRPVQIVVAGKAHPADDGGKRLIQELVRFADDPRVRHRVVFLPDYGMGMAQKLYPGCDVWLNNPLRPLEACGTSGMKAALNGCLNLSVRDGWWDEWFEPDFGWAIPTADGSATDEERRDELEAGALYALLEDRVAPRFYDRGAEGLPERWIEMVRRTLVTLGPKVLAGRMVREYVERLYAPAALARRQLTPAAARELADWKAKVRAAWPQVAVGHVEASADTVVGGSAELGSTLALRVRIALGGLDPDDVEVQAVAGRVDTSDAIAEAQTYPLKPAGGHGLEDRQLYEGPLALDRTGPYGYTVRVLPSHPLLASGAELGLVAVPGETTGADTAGDAGVLLR